MPCLRTHKTFTKASACPDMHMIIPRSLIEIFYARRYMMLIFN